MRSPAATFTGALRPYRTERRHQYEFPGGVSVLLEPRMNGGRVGQVSAWYISEIISEHERGKGHGGNALRTLCDAADQYDIRLDLLVGSIDGHTYPDSLTVPQLRLWYARFGFVNRGHGTDFMTRKPKPPIK